MLKSCWATDGKESKQVLRSQKGLLWLLIFSGLIAFNKTRRHSNKAPV
jgi:hypothetical protein